MSTAKTFSDLPVISALGASDTLTVVTANGLKRISLSGLLAKVQMSARNLMRSTIYSKVVSGARFTNGRTIGDDSNHRFNLTHIIDEQGPYSISFWAKCATGPKTFRVDINDCSVSDTVDLGHTTVGTEWQFISGTVNVTQSIGVYGFVDFMDAGGVTISDVCVVKGSVPMRDWTPAPEDSASSGGVKYCTSYAIEREGGARYEYARKGTERNCAGRTSAESYGVQRDLHECGHLFYCGSLLNYDFYTRSGRTRSECKERNNRSVRAKQSRILSEGHLLGCFGYRGARWQQKSVLVASVAYCKPHAIGVLTLGKEAVA